MALTDTAGEVTSTSYDGRDAVSKYATRNVNPDRLAAIRDYSGRSILDVGCGNGAYVLRLADEYDIRGVDHAHFETWRERPELFSISDATQLDLPGSSVDTIVSFETLEHLSDPDKALREYYRVARKNVILTVPNCDLTPGLTKSNLLYSHWRDRTHVNFFNMQSITAAVEKAGFRIRYKAYINRISLGPVIMESLGIKGFPARAGARIFSLMQRRSYYITSLVVGEKQAP